MSSGIWGYRATPQDEALAMEIGFLRQKPYLGQPERNRNYSEGDIWETWQHALTTLSEIAFARMLGMWDFVPTVNTHKTEPDVGIWEVRYGFPKNDVFPGLRFSEGVDNPDAPYVLLTGGPFEKQRRSPKDDYRTEPFFALGWMWGHECINSQFETMYSTPNRRKFLVPHTSLRSMSEISVSI